MMNEVVVVVPSSSSESSSGCESGWTLYLQHSTPTLYSNDFRNTSFGENNQKQESLPKIPKLEDQLNHHKNGVKQDDEEEEEEEDLSMVSDASSGPPHIIHQEEEEEENDDPLCYSPRLRTQCMKSYAHESHYYCDCDCDNNNMAENFGLDDTATSHPITSKKTGGIHVQNHQSASFERFIGYSSQGYSATHLQVGLSKIKSKR